MIPIISRDLIWEIIESCDHNPVEFLLHMFSDRYALLYLSEIKE